MTSNEKKSLTRKMLNINSFKSLVSHLTFDEISKVKSNMERIYEEKKDEDELEKQLLEEKNQKLDELCEKILADGYDLDVVMDFVSRQKKKMKMKRKPRPEKYEYYNEEGERQTWTGQGRMPKLIKLQVDNGKDLNDFLIH